MRNKLGLLTFSLGYLLTANVFASGVEFGDPNTILTSYPDQVSITVQGDIASQVSERLAVLKGRRVVDKDIKTTAFINCSKKGDDSSKETCVIYWNNR